MDSREVPTIIEPLPLCKPIALLKTKCNTLRLPRPDGASGLAMTAKEHVLSLRGAKPCSRRKTYYRAEPRSNPIFSTEHKPIEADSRLTLARKPNTRGVTRWY